MSELAKRLRVRYFEIHNEMLGTPTAIRQDELSREEFQLIAKLRELGFVDPYDARIPK